MDQTKKVKTKKKKVFSSKIFTNSSYRHKIPAILQEFFSEDQKTKRSLSKNSDEIRCESTKITNVRAVNTNLGVLGLDLHSSNPKHVNIFMAQSSLGGTQFSFGEAQAVIWGGTAPECPSVVLDLICGIEISSAKNDCIVLVA